MFYREAGEFKTSYRADQQTFPIRLDKIGFILSLFAAFVIIPITMSEYWAQAVFLPFLIFGIAAICLNILTGYCGQVSLGSGGTLNFDSADKCIINSPRIDLGLGARHPVTRGDILKEILLDIVGDLQKAGAKMNTATGNHGAPITATQSAGKKLMKTKKSITSKLNRMNSDLTFTV